ncbi:helix-turn-helix domain-containing protein [Halocatena halophila]|uniref:helix-turn-helix domain-containing protein n=1 Tax=Halocatena halophila TaxID=2814576 RepID=UPI002ED0E49B
MSLIAEIRFYSPELPFMNALATVPSMTLQVEGTVEEHSDQPLVIIWVYGNEFESFEAALEADETIDSVQTVDRFPGRRLYRTRVAETATMVLYPVEAESGISRLSITITANGVDSRIRLPDRDALKVFRQYCEKADVSFSLRGIYEGDESATSGRHELSNKQREALELAITEGYFTVPRKTTLEELSEQLGISRQAASERIRRGCQKLVSNALNVASDQ